ncbi:cytochrome oxidase assembly [Punctularia strigosozonata HHB-11173 SS5]|uniref:cytochrome oxidase assembly n=1 Tax=Punctularia strigosozonata (strain HHB-11173) TaxID=741275 RepID=UPI0004416823|nr:cytochrome oxidase assembly [Punctularia strigosozonata HHB-11173 SS5]EIN10834.1 cytochrome oxidase assembly [Punctularia strigosozonata HHB-11173 SS5]
MLNLFRRNRSSLVATFKRPISRAGVWGKSQTPSPLARQDLRGRILEPRFFSSNAASEETAPPLAPPMVGHWLLLSSTLVFAVIVVGGVTRLTESGLSITEWRPITGILPPLSEDAWMEEFRKYQATPEFKMLNHNISLEEFKSIFYMEWGHRVLGRVIGITFVLPFAYFGLRKKLPARLVGRLTFLGALIGVQGIIGWYMVKSGLEESIMHTPGAVPRVSQYRLAAHLGTAFLLYAAMFYEGLAILLDSRYAHGGPWSGTKESWRRVLENPLVKHFKLGAIGLTCLVFLTALSGAFVAGLDAGLVYNEFPMMGNHIVPPTDELFDPAYAKSPDLSDLWWRNLLENPTTVQFDHRVLAMTTYVCTGILFATTRSPSLRKALPPATRRMASVAFGMANIQVLLGISTLLYLVPVPLAAAHQAGSVALLTTVVHTLLTLRKPGRSAHFWRQVWEKGQAGSKAR